MNNDIFVLNEYRAYERALENFQSRIYKYCTNMENGIRGCKYHMQDETSQKILKDAQQVVDDVKKILDDTQMNLEMVRRIIIKLTSEQTMNM